MFSHGYIEDLYCQWSADPQSVSAEWNAYFVDAASETVSSASVPVPADTALSGTLSGAHAHAVDALPHSAHAHIDNLQVRVERLVSAYRSYGYLYANINPLSEYVTPNLKYIFHVFEGPGNYLDIKEFGITDADMSVTVHTDNTLKIGSRTVGEIIAYLKNHYCQTTGLETLHIQNRTMRNWILNKYEHYTQHVPWDKKQLQRFQKDLIKAEEFERFVHTNFIGQKRFSLEGGEVLIPALRYLLDISCDHGVREIVLGMAHRGRLNVFTNALRKRAAETFGYFTDTYQPHTYGGSGDVKYHLGHNFNVNFGDNRSIHVSLVANPSHLEAVDAVVVGKCRGIQRRHHDKHRKKVIPILIHGDAAFSGQGIVSEVFNLSQLRGYKTGGTIHIIVNNQIGFTTAVRDSRSTLFASDIAKILPIPIFHVNGDDPEAVVRAIHLALLYRQKFSFDVVIDIVCYRRLGHNEADEPSFTHPIMYRIIQKHDSVRTLYGQHLAAQDVYSAGTQDAFSTRYNQVLKRELDLAKKGGTLGESDAFQAGDWKRYQEKYSFATVNTAVAEDKMLSIGNKLLEIPTGFALNGKLMRLIKERGTMITTKEGFDWSFAEHLAFGTLLVEGYAIRLSGEDCSRGTFSHRHATWWDTQSSIPHSYIPLQHISNTQEWFSVYDSPLSEYSVLGYDYGYSLAQPNILVLWEAQFGDFVNGAQVIIDQFIAAAQSKWHRSSGLVMLLPHAYEGQGSEHSSAHLERFLQLCAEDNMQIVNASTPAQYFHVLRRQMQQSFRKPLIIMTPKSLLRNKKCVSPLADFTADYFHTVLNDVRATPSKIHKIILSSGHHYYDLLAEKERLDRDDVALIRLEQFYPFPRQEITRILSTYPQDAQVIWSQEESRNRGAFHFIREGLSNILQALRRKPCITVSRPESASPATGSFAEHSSELKEVLRMAFEKPNTHSTHTT